MVSRHVHVMSCHASLGLTNVLLGLSSPNPSGGRLHSKSIRAKCQASIRKLRFSGTDTERLAEYGWKPHRDLWAQIKQLRASIQWYMRKTQRANSRFQTVLFQQYSANLSDTQAQESPMLTKALGVARAEKREADEAATHTHRLVPFQTRGVFKITIRNGTIGCRTVCGARCAVQLHYTQNGAQPKTTMVMADAY